MYTAHAPSSPSSSPPSSPTSCIDSSPPSSPCLEPSDLDVFDTSPARSQIPFSHPFAASVKATRHPHLYEKKRVLSTSENSPDVFPTAKRQRHERDFSHDFSETNASISSALLDFESIDRDSSSEMNIWEEAVNHCFSDSHGTIDLSNHNLTYIPVQPLKDIAQLYIPSEIQERKHSGTYSPAIASSSSRQFHRVSTAPASTTDHSPRRFDRTRSTNPGSMNLQRDMIHMFLHTNQFTYLPTELFKIEKLTDLSLRNNLLTFLPPEIALLSNLNSLNVASNRLKYLPSEIMGMNLKQLSVHPNPFIQPPQNIRSLFRSTSARSLNVARPEPDPVSATIPRLPRVTPLFELALRRLFSPSSNSSTSVLRATYELPLAEYLDYPSQPPPLSQKMRFIGTVPPLVRQALTTCDPDSVWGDYDEPSLSQGSNASSWKDPYVDENPNVFREPATLRAVEADDYKRVTGLGKCPSKTHDGVFVMHAEERFTWVKRIGSVTVGEVPLRWRGCQWGCLDFLDTETVAVSPEKEKERGGESSLYDERSDGEPDLDVVQPIQLSGIGIEDFE